MASFKRVLSIAPIFFFTLLIVPASAQDLAKSKEHLDKAKLSFDQGDLPTALEELTKAIESNPRNAVAHNMRGMILVRRQDLVGAYASYQKAVDIDPGNPAFLYNMSSVLYLRKEYETALEYLRKSIDLSPDNYRAYELRSRIWRAKGNTDLADADLKKSQELKAEPMASASIAPAAKPQNRLGTENPVVEKGSPLSTSTKWNPVIEIDDQIFPSLIFALAHRKTQNLPSTYLGDPNGAVGIKITSPVKEAQVRVSVKIAGYAEESTFEGTLTEANKEYSVYPSMRFNLRALAGVREPYPATAVFSVSLNGMSLGEQTRTIQVRSINDVPFAHKTKEGKVQDLSFLFAAFVDENHPWIDGVLSEALKNQSIRQFIGYQGTPEDVAHQVFAIWNVLQRRQVRYSSITRPSGQSGTVLSQHVRFLDETIKNSEANCVDGTVLFASMIYKLDMCPVLVNIPGHMFLGVHLDRQSCGTTRNLMFLETTMLGNPGLNALQRGWKFLNPDSSYKSSESYRQFVAAFNYANKEFQSVIPSLNSHQPGYHLIEIDAARRGGISAIPRF